MLKRKIVLSCTLVLWGLVRASSPAVEPAQQQRQPALHNRKPRMTIVIVVDQLAYHYFPKIKPFLKHGLKRLFDCGVSYERAYFPHASPNTACGHAALATGTYADIHGIIDNRWYDENNEKYEAAKDPRPESAVFAPNGGLYSWGLSSVNLMADTLSDQFMLQSEPCKKYHCISLSHKNRAAIMMAGKSGAAFWFDDKSGGFTTSKAYFPKMPRWLVQFNKKHRIADNLIYRWETVYGEHSDAYDFREIRNYAYAALPRLVGTDVRVDRGDREPYENLLRTPFGLNILFDLARAAIQDMVTKRAKDRYLIWISLSCLDKLGHPFGPDSQEAIDLMYHLDASLGSFMKFVERIIPKKEVLYAFTADHGIFQIPEVLESKGFHLPVRVMAGDIINNINEAVQHYFGVEHYLALFDAPFFVTDKSVVRTLDADKKQAIDAYVKQLLSITPGIRKVWLPEELAEKDYQPGNFLYFFKRQVYPGRTGDFVVLTHPYIMLTKYPRGTSHTTPYWYDIHVPLILLQEGRLRPTSVKKLVSTLQLSVTLADMIGVTRPSAALEALLPLA